MALGLARLGVLRSHQHDEAVAVGAEHCTRHTHRAWEATPEAERPERSRRNMGIVHAVFFGRKDLTVP